MTIATRTELPEVTSGEHKKLMEQPPSSEDLSAARRLQFLCSMGPSVVALNQGKLMSLGAELKQGMVIMKGRFCSEDLARLLGKDSLPVLMPNTRLAWLILNACHLEDHRMSASDAVARSRNYAWIV